MGSDQNNVRDELERRRSQLLPQQRLLLEERLNQRRQQPAQSPIPHSTSPTLPLSCAQQRIWFFDQLAPGSAAYHVTNAMRLAGALSGPALLAALETISARHEMLRTSFRVIDGVPHQYIHAAPPCPFVSTSVDRIETDALDEWIHSQIWREAERPFNLSQDPAWRAYLIALAPDDHVLILTMHHIMTDGWSWGVFLHELAAAYASHASGAAIDLPALPIQYADFTLWQAAQRDTAEQRRDLDYWCRQLRNLPPLLALPFDHPRPPELQPRKLWLSAPLPAPLTAQLRAFSASHHVTDYVTLLTAFKILLLRYTNQSDVVVGTLIANRQRPEFEPLIGILINLLVLRTDLDATLSTHAAIKQVQTMLRQAFEHQDLPIELLIEAIQPERDLIRLALCNVLFVFQNTPGLEISLPGLKATQLAAPKWITEFDLTLEVSEQDDQLAIAVEYHAGLFDRATIERLIGHYQLVLEQLLSPIAQPIATLGLLTPPERAQFARWNSTAQPFNPDLDWPTRFAGQVAHTPNAIAAVCGNERLTYHELDVQSNRLAQHLVDAGVGPETLVVLLADRSLVFLTAIIAVLKAGGAYLPLNPHAPPQRMRQMIAQSQSPYLLVSREHTRSLTPVLAEVPSAARPQILILEDWLEQPAATTALPVRHHPHNLAYVIFTSGSTGIPKGAMVQHAGMLNHLTAKIQDLGLTAADRVAQNGPQTFDISVWQFLSALTVGGEVHIIPDVIAHDPERLLAYVAASKISVLQVVPSMLRALLDVLGQGLPDLPALRWLVPTGEALPFDLTQRWLRAYPAIPVLNTYGATECSDDQCHYSIESLDRLTPAMAIVTIGAPLINTQVYVLDPQFQPVPVGVAGELYISGAGVGRGYLHDPLRTSLAFRPNPFAASPGSRMYKTGDLARFRADGTLEFLGRLDHQVKIRGFRIELGEIETTLNQHPDIQASVVVAHKNPANQLQLVAYVVASQPGPSKQSLRWFVGERLPEYMVPDLVMVLDRLPLTPNGKLNRSQLPSPSVIHNPEAAFVAPQTLLERQIADVWMSVLNIPKVGLHDNFFRLGGHSLLAAHLVARMRAALGIDVALRSLFASPTIAALVEATRASQTELAALPALHSAPEQRYDRFALTDLQQAYWVGQTDLFDLGNVTGQIYQELALEGFDISRLEGAFQQLIARHDMLRAVIRPDGWQQVLATVPPFPLPLVDLSHLSAPAIAQTLLASADELRLQPLRTDEWPLFRIQAYRLPGNRLRLQWKIALLICDGWSMAIFGQDLLGLYQGISLAPLELTFRDYVTTVQQLQTTAQSERARAYWLGRIKTLPPAPQLPLRINPAQMANPQFTRRRGRLEPALWQRFQATASQHGVTVNAALCAVYSAILATWSSSPHFTLNVLQAHRLEIHPEVGAAVGNFSSTLMLEIQQQGAAPFITQVKRLQAQLWSDLDHTLMTGIMVSRELARAQGVSAHPAMPVVFASMLNVPIGQRPPIPADLQVGEVASSIHTPQVWLDHQIFEEDGGLVYTWDAIDSLFPADLISTMFAAYATLLHNLSASPALWEQADQGIVPAAQRLRRSQANASAGRFSAALLHELAANQALAQPDHVCVITAEDSLTYQAVQQRAITLAAQLQHAGAQPRTQIAVVMEKGWEQVVAVLAVHSLGAAYVPIEPGLPPMRLQILLANAGITYVLTQALVDRQVDWPPTVQRILVDHAALNPADGPLNTPTTQPTDLAYIIYTSGSTGQPKGVMIDHRGAVNTILDMNARFEIAANDRILALSALTFDLSVFDIFGMLAAGGSIVMPSAADLHDPAAWVRLIQTTGVTIWNSVPALLDLLLNALEARPIAPPPSLRQIWLSGDWIPLHMPERIWALWPNMQIISLGGATEASIWSIFYPISQIDPQWRSIPYGYPLANQSWHVLDADLNPRPDWATGSLYIGGAGLAQGYWNDPHKTSASFLTHPQTGETIYRTGDLGRYTPDGWIEFLGREDFQVKIQGYRIELGEIEVAFSHHPDVQSVVVCDRTDHTGTKYLAAYVVLKPASGATRQSLRQHIRAYLPAYMLPSVISILAAMPLSINGKADRRALPDPVIPAGGAAPYQPKDSDWVEDQLSRVWAEVFDLPALDIHTNFFDLGGTSITAIRLRSRIAERLGVRLPLASLFASPTIAEQAALIRQSEFRAGHRSDIGA